MFLQQVGPTPGDWPPGVHVNPELSASSPEKKNPHIDVARGVLFVEPSDWVLYTVGADPVAVLTTAQYAELVRLVGVVVTTHGAHCLTPQYVG